MPEQVAGRFEACSGDCGAGDGSGEVVGRLLAGFSKRVVAEFRAFWTSV